ncbi:MAG: hypothetical protein ASARMPRED_008043 [Alectoria sarmentosa]|nr:MAG: hypothetical protein ASARMPRED_008043 [Alectoria sarmentosa]
MAQEISSNPPPPPQWVINLNSSPRPKAKNTNITNPPGYTETGSGKRTAASSKIPARKPPTTAETDTLKLKKSWELALAPAKALPMNAIMMYMSGNSLQIFSIMMVFMLFKNPITGIFTTNEVFRRFESEGTRKQLWLVKACYVLMNCVALALGVWKVNGMGLLPTTRSDWLAWETERQPLERAIFAFG